MFNLSVLHCLLLFQECARTAKKKKPGEISSSFGCYITAMLFQCEKCQVLHTAFKKSKLWQAYIYRKAQDKQGDLGREIEGY